MLMGRPQQLRVPQLLGSVEDDSHVHHDIDEEGILGHEGSQVLPLRHEAGAHGPPRRQDDGVHFLVAGKVVPALPSRPEQEAQIVDRAIGLTRFEEARVALGLSAPLIGAGAQVEDPHHAGQESLAPVRPGLTRVDPFPTLCVGRQVIRMGLHQAPNLSLREFEGVLQSGPEVARLISQGRPFFSPNPGNAAGGRAP